jgi:hypothetical protein
VSLHWLLFQWALKQVSVSSLKQQSV